MTMVIIGGMGLRLGPFVGAAIVIALGEGLAEYPEAHVAITGIILILLIRFAPRGAVGFLDQRVLSFSSKREVAA